MQTQTKSLEETLLAYFEIKDRLNFLQADYGDMGNHLDLMYYFDKDRSNIQWVDDGGEEYSAEIYSVNVEKDITFVTVFSDFGGRYTMVLRTKNKLTKEQAEEKGIEV